jgi:hypothetical protein
MMLECETVLVYVAPNYLTLGLLCMLHSQICRDEYCAMDETTGKQILLSKEEKERIFLDSIQSFYYR